MNAVETNRAMFRAALAAQAAGEPYVSADRIAGSLLHTDAVRDLCSRARIDSAQLLQVFDDPRAPSFEECARRLKEDPSPLPRRPLDPLLKPALDAFLARHGHLAIPPLQLLLEILRADPELATRLASHGLTPEVIRAEFGNENQ